MEEEEQNIEEIQNTSFKGGWQIKQLIDDVWNAPSPFQTGKEMVTGYIDTRQQLIDNTAQFTDKVVTSGLQKINMPGAEFIGDRARNIAGFATDVVTPEVWELPLYGATLAEPTPFGELGVYGIGLSTRLAKAQLKAQNILSSKVDNWFGDAFSRFNPNGLFNRRYLATEGGPNIDGSQFASISKNQGGYIPKPNLSKLSNKVYAGEFDDFLLGKTAKISRAVAPLIQDLKFSQKDFFGDLDKRVKLLKKQYPGIDIDTPYQNFKWQWHHINPQNMPVDFYVGLTNRTDRDLLSEALFDRTGIFAGNNPLNNKGLPTNVHHYLTQWMNKTIGPRAGVLKQQIAKEMGLNLKLDKSNRFSKADQIIFNNAYKNLPVSKRIEHITKYGKEIQDSKIVLNNLMEQFDLMYKVPEGYRLDVDENDWKRIFQDLPLDIDKRLKTVQEIIGDVLADKQLKAIHPSDPSAPIITIKPRSADEIRLEELGGFLKDANTYDSVKQGTIKQRQINAWVKEMEEILQKSQGSINFDNLSKASYLKDYYLKNFGGTRKGGSLKEFKRYTDNYFNIGK